ncbi:hypothetical protein KX729_31890 [Rhizobium sp. XQZ8]|uniref:hypothetical protein n=1 Tax=Rhizobium populisoli TaxID=2859785 RepID=UPI001CA514B0|nr:hypothetical protein [Rhizobium populisoli]MBW6425981.1 hypothetical protein [Rhizobium populisoli]
MLNFKKLKIAYRTVILTIVAVTSLLVVSAIFFAERSVEQGHARKVAELEAFDRSVSELDTLFLQVRRFEKDFLLRKDEQSIANHLRLSNQLLSSIKTLETQINQQELSRLLTAIGDSYSSYGASSISLSQQTRTWASIRIQGLKGRCANPCTTWRRP